MVHRSIIKPVASLRGIGKVFNEGRLIAQVTYNLDVLRQEFWPDPLESSPAEENSESTIGSITITEKGKRLYGPNTFVLLLQDNRRMNFEVKKVDPFHPKYVIQSFGSFN